jgi:hypothetical protein
VEKKWFESAEWHGPEYMPILDRDCRGLGRIERWHSTRQKPHRARGLSPTIDRLEGQARYMVMMSTPTKFARVISSYQSISLSATRCD